MDCSYLVNGSGYWLTLWEASGHDRLLAAATIATAAAILAFALVYAVQSQYALRLIQEVHFAQHIRDIRNVILLFAVTQFIVSVVGWVAPMHWLVIAIRLVNIWVFGNLIRSKSQILSIQKHVDGETAVLQVSNAVGIIEKQKRASVLDEISHVESVLRRAR